MLGSSFPGSSVVKLGLYYIHRNIGTMVKCSEKSVNDPSSYNSSSPLNTFCYAYNFISLSYTSYYKFVQSVPKNNNWCTWIHCSGLQMLPPPPSPPHPWQKVSFCGLLNCLGMKEKKSYFSRFTIMTEVSIQTFLWKCYRNFVECFKFYFIDSSIINSESMKFCSYHLIDWV